MLKGKSASELAMIGRSGGGFVLDGSDYSASNLAMIGRSLDSQSRMTIMNSSRFSTSDLSMVARSAPGRISFS